MAHTYSGGGAGTGAVHAWKGNNKAGEGRMEITTTILPRARPRELTFVKPFKSENTTRFPLAESGRSTNVTWSMVTPMRFMMHITGVLMHMEKRIGEDFDKGLAKLATLATELKLRRHTVHGRHDRPLWGHAQLAPVLARGTTTSSATSTTNGCGITRSPRSSSRRWPNRIVRRHLDRVRGRVPDEHTLLGSVSLISSDELPGFEQLGLAGEPVHHPASVQ